jgi:catechol 2,3-dioxygenase-like lactoylglutathione lyase family enzyme
MISGAHVVVYSKNAEVDRHFFRDVLGFKSVDAGHGWLIFSLPPAEAAFHPSEEQAHELYLMCDDLKAEMDFLGMKGVKFSKVVGYANNLRCNDGSDRNRRCSNSSY